MIYEIRNYHFEPQLMEEYKRWARQLAVPYLSQKVDVVGFWVDCGIAADVRGEPLDKLGSATVTWIIRWNSRARRDSELAAALATDEWRAIFAEVPGGAASYQRIECRFFEAL